MRIIKYGSLRHRTIINPPRLITTISNNPENKSFTSGSNIDIKISQDTHFYDGKLKDELVISTNVSKLDLTPIFPEFKKLLENNKENSTYSTAIQALNLIENDVSGNYDSTNQFRADTILYLLYQKLKGMSEIDPSLINVIMEGLSDIITSGSCPQGRSTRLYQLYISLD